MPSPCGSGQPAHSYQLGQSVRRPTAGMFQPHVCEVPSASWCVAELRCGVFNEVGHTACALSRCPDPIYSAQWRESPSGQSCSVRCGSTHREGPLQLLRLKSPQHLWQSAVHGVADQVVGCMQIPLQAATAGGSATVRPAGAVLARAYSVLAATCQAGVSGNNMHA